MKDNNGVVHDNIREMNNEEEFERLKDFALTGIEVENRNNTIQDQDMKIMMSTALFEAEDEAKITVVMDDEVGENARNSGSS